MLWLAEEERKYTTGDMKTQFDLELWLAEEERKYTTVRTYSLITRMLWLAEEERKYTTITPTLWLSSSCGLLKKRGNIQLVEVRINVAAVVAC